MEIKGRPSHSLSKFLQITLTTVQMLSLFYFPTIQSVQDYQQQTVTYSRLFELLMILGNPTLFAVMKFEPLALDIMAGCVAGLYIVQLLLLLSMGALAERC